MSLPRRPAEQPSSRGSAPLNRTMEIRDRIAILFNPDRKGVLWATRPEHLSWDEFELRIGDLAEAYRAATGDDIAVIGTDSGVDSLRYVDETLMFYHGWIPAPEQEYR